MLPVHQVRKGQTWLAHLLIEPDTTVMQGHLGGQASLQASEVMGPLAIQTDGMMDVLIDCCDDLTHPGQPAAPLLGPGELALPLRRTHDLGPIAIAPARLCGLPLAALIADLGAQRGLPDAPVAGVLPPPQGKEALSQWLILGTGGAKAKTGDPPRGLTAMRRGKPSYQPRRLLQPRSARPGSQPAPRRLASRVGIAELSRAS
jgi:hypothetical protein